MIPTATTIPRLARPFTSALPLAALALAATAPRAQAPTAQEAPPEGAAAGLESSADGQGARAPLAPLAMVGGVVHTPGGGAEVATVVIERDRVVAVGPEVEPPDGARVIDVSGRHVVPGLIDGLAYHDPLHDLLYTTAGVTLIRDHGNDLADVLEQARPLARDAALGPDISTAGAVLDGSPPSTGAALVLRDEHEARHRTELLLEQGVDFLALQVNLGLPAFEAVLAVAAEAGVQVWGPIPTAVGLDRALEAGAPGTGAEGGLSGLLFLDRLLPAGKGWSEVSSEELDPLVERLAASGLAIVPLLNGTARLLHDPRAVVGGEPVELRLVGPEHAGHWRAELEARAPQLADPTWLEHGRQALAAQRALVLRLHQAGVPIVPGSGAPHPWLAPGAGLHAELAQLAAAGLTPAEVLAAVTTGAADALGLEDRGRIAPGAVADLLVLGGDPREELAALRDIDTVVLRGRVLEWGQLDQQLAALEVRLEELAERLDRPIAVDAPPLPEGAVVLRGLAESSSVAGRLAAERFAVVREVDDSLTFVGRRAARTAEGQVVVDVSQRYSGGKLAGFSVELRTGGHELVVKGLSVAGSLRVERRLDGHHVSTLGVRERVMAIDVGSVTSVLALGQFQGEGGFPVLRFDQGLELEVVRWELALNPEGDHVIRTPVGLKLASFQESGALRVVVDQTGSGSVTTQFPEVETLGGPGPGLPADKLARVRTRGPAEASAPAAEGAPDDERASAPERAPGDQGDHR